jgi:5,6,7,8-tetrahydromethanopterin hydro-lyase
MKTRKINKVLLGQALVGEGNEVAYVDLIMGCAVAPWKPHFA